MLVGTIYSIFNMVTAKRLSNSMLCIKILNVYIEKRKIMGRSSILGGNILINFESKVNIIKHAMIALFNHDGGLFS